MVTDDKAVSEHQTAAENVERPAQEQPDQGQAQDGEARGIDRADRQPESQDEELEARKDAKLNEEARHPHIDFVTMGMFIIGEPPLPIPPPGLASPPRDRHVTTNATC